MSAPGDEESAQATRRMAMPGSGRRLDPEEPSHSQPGAPVVNRSIWLLEHAQDVVTISVGVILIALSAVLIVAALVDFASQPTPIATKTVTLLESVLLVLILVEIVHTVVLSLRSHHLVAQPLIVVGLVAVIREILLLLSPGEGAASTSELALLIAMVAVFIAALIAVSRFEKNEE
jgi:uncharacterized membrane protein (DUF373 family)